MVCRHSKDDPDCSSNRSYYRPEPPKTPDAKNYSVLDIEQVGKHLVMKVEYPNCRYCSYEGKKVMVFLNTSPLDAIKWKVIDPHFRDPSKGFKRVDVAPSPAARFPASPDGWCDAVSYARGKD